MQTSLYLLGEAIWRQAVQSLRDPSAVPPKSPAVSFPLQLLAVYLLCPGPQGCCSGSRCTSVLGGFGGTGKLKGERVAGCMGPYFQDSKSFLRHPSRRLSLTHWTESCLMTTSSCKKGEPLAFAASVVRQASQKGWKRYAVSDSQCP